MTKKENPVSENPDDYTQFEELWDIMEDAVANITYDEVPRDWRTMPELDYDPDEDEETADPTSEALRAMKKPRSRAGGVYVVDDMGRKSDTAIHEKIMAGVNDYPQRLQSAKRLMAATGLTKQEAEAIFDVAIDSDVQ